MKQTIKMAFTAAVLSFCLGAIVGAVADSKDAPKENPEVGAETRRFVCVETADRRTETQYAWDIWCDTETGVLYAEKSGTYGGITVLLDAEGKPLLYEGAAADD